MEEGDDTHVNIRYCPTKEFKDAIDFMEKPIHFGEPKLTIEFITTCGKLYAWKQEKQEDDGLPPTFELPHDEEIKIGRLKKNTLSIPGGKVSRNHAIIQYEEGFGWMIWEQVQTDASALSTTSGTWVHPKSYSLAVGGDNSNPVKMHNGMRIRASTYVFEFLFEEV